MVLECVLSFSSRSYPFVRKLLTVSVLIYVPTWSYKFEQSATAAYHSVRKCNYLSTWSVLVWYVLVARRHRFFILGRASLVRKDRPQALLLLLVIPRRGTWMQPLKTIEYSDLVGTYELFNFYQDKPTTSAARAASWDRCCNLHTMLQHLSPFKFERGYRIPGMTVYNTPPVVIFCVLDFITWGGILWGCGIHCTPGDKVGGRLGFNIFHYPRVVYCRGVIRGGGSSGYKRVLLPYSRQSGVS